MKARQIESLFTPPPEILDDLRSAVVTSMLERGFPAGDAEAIAAHILERIIADPTAYATKLFALDEHRNWLIGLALESYLTKLREERHRRRWELYRWLGTTTFEDCTQPGVVDVEAVLAVAAATPLTSRQRFYLEAVVAGSMPITTVAELYGTTPAAVRTILRRAVAALRHHLHVTASTAA